MYDTLAPKLSEKNVLLVAISKTKPPEAILDIYHKGHRTFGENKVQELVQKYEVLPKDIQWHLVGHLQSNKVKYIAPFITMIHSVDSLKLLKEINKQAKKQDRVIQCLLQIKIAKEDTKFGLDKRSAIELLNADVYAQMENIRIAGVMGMGTLTANEDQTREEFQTLKRIFEQLKGEYFNDDPNFKEISMGMSGDYEIAIEEGSTMVRIGSLIFGARNYS